MKSLVGEPWMDLQENSTCMPTCIAGYCQSLSATGPELLLYGCNGLLAPGYQRNLISLTSKPPGNSSTSTCKPQGIFCLGPCLGTKRKRLGEYELCKTCTNE